MKRIWSLCALLALLCALTIPAMAAAGGETSSEASGQIRTSMMMGLVFIETVIIYALIVAILIIFVL